MCFIESFSQGTHDIEHSFKVIKYKIVQYLQQLQTFSYIAGKKTLILMFIINFGISTLRVN